MPDARQGLTQIITHRTSIKEDYGFSNDMKQNDRIAQLLVRDFLLTEMATVGQVRLDAYGKTCKLGVDGNFTRRGEPYFKYYNSSSPKTATGVARISFLAPRYIIHSGYPLCFKLTREHKEALLRFLHEEPIRTRFAGMTNWQLAITFYNEENYSELGIDWDTFTKEEQATYGKNSLARFALPVDLPMPNYLLLR